VLADRRQEFGIEPIRQGERFDQHGTVDGQIEVVDCRG
jgi:hypothetical protein